jgi:tungstate transport system permease protein
MQTLFDAFLNAFQLLVSGDPELLAIVGLTLRVTGIGLMLALLLGLPVGALLGLMGRFPGGGCIIPLIYTGMGLPPVVVGLFVYLLLSNQGPLG